MRFNVIPALAVALCFAAPVEAQVYKCKDASGKISLTDRPCDGASQGGLVSKKVTTEQQMLTDQQAYEGRERFYAEKAAADQQRAERAYRNQMQYANQSAAINAQLRGLEQNKRQSDASYSTMDSYHSPAAEQKRQQVRDERAAEAERSQLENPQPAPFINCNGRHCTDNNGGSYLRRGDRVTSSDGRTCRVAGQWGTCQ